MLSINNRESIYQSDSVVIFRLQFKNICEDVYRVKKIRYDNSIWTNQQRHKQ